MRWPDYGWQLGKVYEQITNVNPRLFKKYNYRVVWADTAKGPTSLRPRGELRARLRCGSQLVGGARAQGGRRQRSRVGGGIQRAGRGPVRRGVSQRTTGGIRQRLHDLDSVWWCNFS